MSMLCKPSTVPGRVSEVGVNSHFGLTAIRFRTAYTPDFTSKKQGLMQGLELGSVSFQI